MLNIDKFIEEYEVTQNGITYISYLTNQKNLLISLSTHHEGDKHYMNLRNIYVTKDDYKWDFLLFYNFPTDYYDKVFNKIYNIIKDKQKDYDNIYVIGSSMSGTVAIKLGLMLNINIIASVPQFNLHITYKTTLKDRLKKTIDRITDLNVFTIDAKMLEKYLPTFDKKFTIVSGLNYIDVANNLFFNNECKKIDNKLVSKINFIKINTSEHTFFLTFYNTPSNLIYIKSLL